MLFVSIIYGHTIISSADWRSWAELNGITDLHGCRRLSINFFFLWIASPPSVLIQSFWLLLLENHPVTTSEFQNSRNCLLLQIESSYIQQSDPGTVNEELTLSIKSLNLKGNYQSIYYTCTLTPKVNHIILTTYYILAWVCYILPSDCCKTVLLAHSFIHVLIPTCTST